jgi:YesN/AraC family two-component response regulator
MGLSRYELSYARNGTDALQKAQDSVPDLVITDLMMPGAIDGLMLCRSIRQSDLLSHVPIIIITAKADESDRVKGIESGADAYLVKPFDQQELAVRVEKLLERQQVLRQKFMELHVSEHDKEHPLSAADRQLMNKLIDHIYALMAQGNVDVESLAQRMAMSRSQLNRRVLTITGQNTSSYVMRVRMSYAKRLLKADILRPVGDVALKCGFDDVAYFSRIFKQTFDITPTQYRRQH